tara:strand:+ start:3601 stop:4068 length:468 start_codon:yes stop_codon:yes gene_type:complete
MKKILLLSLILISFTSNSQDVKANTETPLEEVSNVTIDFESKVVDYGTIEHNSDGARKFVFTNNGTEPLQIKSAKGSCGCTVPTWPREPIAPGETAEIGVKYATNRVGPFTKTITLSTNASKKPVILTIKGKVNPAPKEETAPVRKTEGSPLEKK